MLHHYSESGELIGEFLPRWSSNTAYVVEQIKNNPNSTGGSQAVLTGYSKDDIPIAEYSSPMWGLQRAYLDASPLHDQAWLEPYGSSVAILDGQIAVIYTFDQNGHNISRQKIAPATIGDGAARITGFAALPQANFYISVQSADGSGPYLPGIESGVLARATDRRTIL